MAILSNTIWRVNPGRGADFMKVAGEAKKIHERLGGKPFLVNWTNAGSGTGTFGYGILFPDFPAWGRFADALAVDPEWLGWAQKNLNTADSTATLVSQSTLADQPGFDAPDPVAPGTFIQASSSVLAPGRSAEEVLRLAHDYKTIALDLGAQWVRFRRTILGGEATLSYIVTTGHASAAAYGEWQTKLLTDQRGQAFLQAAFGPSSPLTGFVQQSGRALTL